MHSVKWNSGEDLRKSLKWFSCMCISFLGENEVIVAN